MPAPFSEVLLKELFSKNLDTLLNRVSNLFQFVKEDVGHDVGPVAVKLFCYTVLPWFWVVCIVYCMGLNLQVIMILFVVFGFISS